MTGSFALALQTGQVVGGATSVTASLMSGDVGVQITGGSGGFVLTSAGTALHIEGSAAFVTMPGLLMSETLTLEMNTLDRIAWASAWIIGDPSGQSRMAGRLPTGLAFGAVWVYSGDLC